MDILNLITEQLSNGSTLQKLGKSVGADSDQVQKLAQLGLPAILQALESNASTNEGRDALSKALDNHQDDNIDDIDGFLDNVDTNDGSKMLQHIFSGKSDKVLTNLSKKSGLDSGQVVGILAQVAPLLIGALGKQKKTENIGTSGVSDLLGNLINKGKSSGILNMATNLLDSDNDGDITDDIGKILGGFLKK